MRLQMELLKIKICGHDDLVDLFGGGDGVDLGGFRDDFGVEVDLFGGGGVDLVGCRCRGLADFCLGACCFGD